MTIEGTTTGAAPRRIRLGMVGGGQGAFIGGVHRMAARLDDRYELVAGALSSDAARSAASAAELHIAPDRSYADYADMAKREAALTASGGDGIDAVAIVTPNHLHGRIASAFLDAGIHVICDKPLTSTLAEALALVERVRSSGRLFALTHNYSGYPMVRQAREMVAAGALGETFKIAFRVAGRNARRVARCGAAAAAAARDQPRGLTERREPELVRVLLTELQPRLAAVHANA